MGIAVSSKCSALIVQMNKLQIEREGGEGGETNIITISGA